MSDIQQPNYIDNSPTPVGTPGDGPVLTGSENSALNFVGESFSRLLQEPQMSSDQFKSILKSGDLTFTFNGKEYTLSYNEKNGNVQAFHGDTMVDNEVQLPDSNLTVAGFVEVGIRGELDPGNRLYIGLDDDNNLVIIEASAKLDAHIEPGPAGSHRQTLLNEGIVHSRTPIQQLDEPVEGGPAETPIIPETETDEVTLEEHPVGTPTGGEPAPAPADDEVPDGTGVVPTPQANDGPDLYVIDNQGEHGVDVTNTAQYFAGDGVQIITNSPAAPVTDPAATTPGAAPAQMSREDSVQQVVTLASVTVDYIKSNFDWENNPVLSQTVSGLEKTISDFQNGTEDIGDYFFISDTINFLQLQEGGVSRNQNGVVSPATQLYNAWQSASNTHLLEFSGDNAPIQAVLNGEVALTPEHRAQAASTTEGFGALHQYLTDFSTQLSTLSIDQVNDQFFMNNASVSALGDRNYLFGQLHQIGLVDQTGAPIPLEGFDADNQPVRVVNVSLGGSIVTTAMDDPSFRFLEKYPPAEGTVLYNSIVDNLPPEMQQGLQDGSLSISDVIKTAGVNALVNNPNFNARVDSVLAETHAITEGLLDANIIIVASAGNHTGLLPGTVPQASRNLLISDNMISVGASNDQGTASTEDDTIAEFSSFGADFVLDGVDVDEGNGDVNTGTSFSSPAFAGLLAKALDLHPELNARDVMDILNDPEAAALLFTDIAGTDLDGSGILTGDLASILGSYNPRANTA